MDCGQCAEQMLDIISRMNSIPSVQAWRFIHATHGETVVLKFLAAHGGEASPGDISRILGRTNSRIANTLNSLQEKNCIVRLHDAGDRRRVTVQITAHGLKVVQRRRQEILGVLTRIMKELGQHDANEYIRLNARIIEIISSNSIYAENTRPKQDASNGKKEAKNG